MDTSAFVVIASPVHFHLLLRPRSRSRCANAHCLFDGMTMMGKQNGAAAEGGDGSISALPDAILEQVLCVCSSVLSRRLPVFWKSRPDLRITDPDS